MTRERQTCMSLIATGAVVKERLEVALCHLALSLRRMEALEEIQRHPEGIGVTALKGPLGMGTDITRLLDQLEGLCMVERFRHRDGDRRAVLVRITDYGLEQYRAGMEALELAAPAVLADVLPGHVEDLKALKLEEERAE